MANIKSIGGNPIVPDQISGGATEGKYALLTAGAANGITGEATDSAAWLQRVSTSDGPTTVKSIHGRTLRWNQLVSDSDTSVTVPSGHKYVARIDGTTTLATSDGTAITVTGGTDSVFDLTVMFGAGSEPSTVAEFEALYPLPYYPYDPGSLLPVHMTGVETVGFNQWDEQWELGTLSTVDGSKKDSTANIRTKNFNPCLSNTAYCIKLDKTYATGISSILFYDADKHYLTYSTITSLTTVVTTPANAHYFTFALTGQYGTTYNHDICINISDLARNGTYEPYWSSQRTIPAATYFPQGMRSAGTVYDELTETQAITRVGERAYQLGDESDPTVVTDGTITHYVLATPTTVEIDPPLNLIYRTAAGGTERVMVPTGEQSAPPTIVTAQGYTAESLRDAALSAIAPVENGKASTNYGVGSYLVHGGQICKVTTAIATGESITIGTNVTATTVMAEVIALIAQ